MWQTPWCRGLRGRERRRGESDEPRQESRRQTPSLLERCRHPPAGKCSPSENPAPDGEAGHASVKCQVLLPLDLPVMGWVLPRV